MSDENSKTLEQYRDKKTGLLPDLPGRLDLRKPKPGFAPVYAAIYPELAKLCRMHGYALAVHGSMARDFDLIAIPWIDEASDPETVVKAITTHYDFKEVGGPATLKKHGRLAYSLAIGFGECCVDLSFMPRTTPP